MATKKTSAGSTPAKTRRGVVNPRPRNARAFNFMENSRPQGRVPRGDKTLKPGAPEVEIVRPAWNGKSGTTFRIAPCFDLSIEDDNVFAHGRILTQDFGFGISDWARGYPAVKYVGLDQKLRFLLYDPRDERSGAYDPSKNPYIVLFQAIRDAVREGEAKIGNKSVITGAWAPLISGSFQKKAFETPAMIYFVQGFIYKHNGEVTVSGSIPRGLREKDFTQVLQLSKTAFDSLFDAINARREGGFDTDDPDQFVYPDPTSLTDPCYVTIFNPTSQAPPGEALPDGGEEEDVAEDDDFEEDSRRSGGRSGGGGFEAASWACSLSSEFPYVREKDGRRAKAKAKPDLTALEERVRERIIWWDNLLHVPCDEEIARYCAQAFRSMPNLLRYGWQEYPEFFTDEVNGILQARTSGPGAEVPSLEDEEDEAPRSRRPKTRSAASLPESDDDDLDDLMGAEDQVEEARRAADRRSLLRGGSPKKKKKARPAASEESPAPRKKKKRRPESTTGQPVPRKKKRRPV